MLIISPIARTTAVETCNSNAVWLICHKILFGTKTKLPTPVKEIVMSIFKIENKKSELKPFKMDHNNIPLGRLSHNQIDLAYGVLKDLLNVLSEVPLDQMKIVDSTNKFHTIVPHNFGFKLPELIDTLDKVNEKVDLLKAIGDLQLDEICGIDSRTIPGVDPVDTHYKRLECSMTPLDKNSSDYVLIENFMKNTQGSTHVMKCDLIDILEINRQWESTKFKKEIGNRRLLWHGSKRMNLAGILGQGLRIAPPEAPGTGYMFGKGVYFADMFSKSLSYCRANSKDEAYLLLCDVALGKMDLRMQATDISKDTLPEGTQSVKGVGRECPSGEFSHPDGFMVPTGEVHQQLQGTYNIDYFLLYNEYIVYDVDQIQIKYLVRVKVH
ncbi:hypothetical protein GCK72_022108 [Caenorhabditis remanei]|uniref:Poly [ADP-ribose] polymerase n=1 Tax=Caenorhabditis remanei TaxID=31234 RepID=A0A6A5FTE6_CAERE|nr:hypothetical protein GCK72_022108 [Caenorhabditis remanei]KAF1745661.1 hypothetical protein GCK72_022108 [Caenorhabditis remanei]